MFCFDCWLIEVKETGEFVDAVYSVLCAQIIYLLHDNRMYETLFASFKKT